MAGAPATPAPEASRPASRGLTGALVGAALVGCLAAAAGAGVAWRLGPARASAPPAGQTTQASAEKAAKPADPRAKTSGLRELGPVVANLAAPDNVWMRIETSVLLDEMEEKEARELAAELAADELAFARTLSLAQLQGAPGLQHLRGDLLERFSIRSRDRVRDVVIHSLVLQ